MILSNLKVRYVNMEKSSERRDSILSDFSDSDLIRIPAIDGNLNFSNGEFDIHNRPKWDDKILTKLEDINVVSSDFRSFYDLTPPELGCNLSHNLAWKLFLNSDEEYSIFIEDDVSPNRSLKDIEVPDDCDVFYLVSQDHPGGRIKYNNKMEVIFSRTLMGYVLSRKAAELCLLASKPFTYQTDWQIPLRLFSSFQGFKRLPKWKELPKLKAYGPKESFVIHNVHSKISTFTKEGNKVWIPKSLLP